MGLIFVYNAKSDKLNALVDYAHKIINPSTYTCDLCKLTHSNLGVRKEWTAFLKEIEIDFYHINEFENKFKHTFKYPVILNNDLQVLLGDKSIAELNSVTELIQKIKEIA